MLKSGWNRVVGLAVLIGFIVVGFVFFSAVVNEDNNKLEPINVSDNADSSKMKFSNVDSLMASRKQDTPADISVKKEEKNEKKEQKFHGFKKYSTFNTANTKPFFKVGPGSVKKLSTEKPEQSNPFHTGVEPSSSDRLPTITVDDESVPAIFSSQSTNDCESQSLTDSLPEIDLLNGELMVIPSLLPDSSKSKNP